MAISLLLPNITAAIDDISITGVVVKNYDGIVANWQSHPMVLYPDPLGFITDFSIDFKTLLRGSIAPQDISYTLHYRYLHTEVGDLSQFAKQYGDMITKVVAILNAILAVSEPYSGAVDMEVVDLAVGPREDPAGNMYHGAKYIHRFEEEQNHQTGNNNHLGLQHTPPAKPPNRSEELTSESNFIPYPFQLR